MSSPGAYSYSEHLSRTNRNSVYGRWCLTLLYIFLVLENKGGIVSNFYFAKLTRLGIAYSGTHSLLTTITEAEEAASASITTSAAHREREKKKIPKDAAMENKKHMF